MEFLSKFSRLKKISKLATTADALDSGFSLLLQPMVDFAYEPSKSIGVNFLFTIPALIPNSAFCTPLKYKLSNHCYQGPIKRDELALLRCQHSEYRLHRDLFGKCFRSDDTFICPQNILHLVNDTTWLGLPWHTDVTF